MTGPGTRPGHSGQPSHQPDHDHDHAGSGHPHHGHPDQHAHGPGGHTHPHGIKGYFHGLFVPHSHDASESIDDALEASSHGVRAVKVGLVGLGATAVFQLVVVLFSGSVALLADTIHNFSDALTAIPLWIAFVLGRRAATRTYTYGYGRAEDLAGLFILAMIALSAILAAYEAIHRLINPRPLDHLGWVLAAGIIGAIGNELVAVYRIRAGRRIGSAALVADGVHARTDGFTSLAVVLGVIGVWLGFPLADPIVGLLITIAIAALLWGTARDVGRRLLDGVDPHLVELAEHALTDATGHAPGQVLLRWSGHRLNVTTTITAPDAGTIGDFRSLARTAEHALRHALPSVGTVTISPPPETGPVPPLPAQRDRLLPQDPETHHP